MTDAAHPNADQAPEEDVTTALYRAAIGPVNANYFLPIFLRFEAADHAGISWNTAASLSTLNWLIFRKLYTPALTYAGLLLTVFLLVFGIGRLVFQFSDTLMMALALGFGFAAFVLPGLFGNAVLHHDCRKRMAKALAAHTVVAEACDALNRQASTRRRAIWLAMVNAAFLVAAVFSYLQFSTLNTLTVMPQGALEAGHVVVGRTTDLAPQSSASAIPPALPATVSSVPTSVPVPAPTSASSEPSPMAVAASEPAPASSAPAPASVANAPAKLASTPVAPPSANATAASASRSSASAARPTTVHITTKETDRQKKTPKDASADKPASAARPTQATTAAASKPVASASTNIPVKNKPYFINVGLFAKPENSARAHAKLLEAQLPSVTRELKSAKGPVTRVRVGPFNNLQDAEAAVEKIQALQLDAIIVQP